MAEGVDRWGVGQVATTRGKQSASNIEDTRMTPAHRFKLSFGDPMVIIVSQFNFRGTRRAQ